MHASSERPIRRVYSVKMIEMKLHRYMAATTGFRKKKKIPQF